MNARFQGLRGDIIEENINKAFKPMKMIAEKIPTVAICWMGKSINNSNFPQCFDVLNLEKSIF